MGKYSSNLPTRAESWGQIDILDNDLEKLEFEKNFGFQDEIYNSILDDEPVYHSFMNYQEEQEDQLYDEDKKDEDENDANQTDEDRNSYRDADMDNVFYLI